MKLKKETLDVATFSEDADKSNRISINGKLLEEWLKAEAGRSACTFCCETASKEVECRTVELEGRIYEAIPSRLIIAAAFKVASELLLQ